MNHLTRAFVSLCLAFCVTSCTFRPAVDDEGNVTIRKSNPVVRSHGIRAFKRLKRTKNISTAPEYTRRVERVASRLQNVIDMPGAEWEFVIFKDNSPNAFCLPGGKVGVNTGVFQLTGDDDALLAAVLGHEISHATANHAEQRMSHAIGLFIGGALIWNTLENNNNDHAIEAIAAYTLGAYIMDSLPLSRRQEHESDKMGAIFMAKAGYDPRKSILLWRLLESHHVRHGGQKPEFLRTHPQDNKRISALEQFMPVAMRYYRQSKKSSSKGGS